MFKVSQTWDFCDFPLGKGQWNIYFMDLKFGVQSISCQ